MKADQIITVSRFTKEEILRYFKISNKNISYIYNGFDRLSDIKNMDKVFPKIRKELSIIPQKYICYVGSATPRKNLLNLVKGYIHFIEKTQSDFKLVLISKFDRELTRSCLNKIKLLIKKYKLEDKIIYSKRYFDDKDKTAVIKNCAVFVFPSLYEGFGLPILEAMNLKKPVICSDIPVFKEIYKNSVLYFDPTKPDSIALTIKKVLADKKLQERLIQSGYNLQKSFDWNKMASEYYKIYMNIFNQ